MCEIRNSDTEPRLNSSKLPPCERLPKDLQELVEMAQKGECLYEDMWAVET